MGPAAIEMRVRPEIGTALTACSRAGSNLLPAGMSAKALVDMTLDRVRNEADSVLE